jgi:hypothetical protein
MTNTKTTKTTKTMKARHLLLFVPLLLVTGGVDSCENTPSSDQVQSSQQEQILAQGTSVVGMPHVKNFRERRLMKDIIEMRDQEGLTTYTYITSNDASGRTVYVFFCNSIGYPIPYATQFTNPQKVGAATNVGYAILPQADPNGLFSPASAEGTWIMCKDPSSDKVGPVYVEPRVIASPFPLSPK